MKKIGGNDVWEAYLLRKGDKTPQQTSVWYERFRMDPRADLMMQIMRAWAVQEQLTEALHSMHEVKEKQRRGAEAMAMRAAETVEAFWQEARRRGWLIETIPYWNADEEEDEA